MSDFRESDGLGGSYQIPFLTEQKIGDMEVMGVIPNPIAVFIQDASEGSRVEIISADDIKLIPQSDALKDPKALKTAIKRRPQDLIIFRSGRVWTRDDIENIPQALRPEPFWEYLRDTDDKLHAQLIQNEKYTPVITFKDDGTIEQYEDYQSLRTGLLELVAQLPKTFVSAKTGSRQANTYSVKYLIVETDITNSLNNTDIKYDIWSRTGKPQLKNVNYSGAGITLHMGTVLTLNNWLQIGVADESYVDGYEAGPKKTGTEAGIWVRISPLHAAVNSAYLRYQLGLPGIENPGSIEPSNVFVLRTALSLLKTELNKIGSAKQAT